MKFKVTNTSQLSAGGKRNIFLTEAGKLIKPGESCVCNRLDAGTKRNADAKVLKVEEGDFAAPALFKKPPVAEPLPPTPNTSLDMERAAADARAMDERMQAEKAEAEAKAKAADDAAAAEAAAAEAAAAEATTAEEPASEMTKAEKKAAAKKAKADARGNS
jgi:hypothetical protein